MAELENVEQKINDLDDLEDRLDVLEGVVEELKVNSLQPSSIKIYMSQYILLEDSLILGIQHMSDKLKSDQDSSRFEECAEKFNTLGADYQDTWPEDYWSTYNLIRGGFKMNDKTKSSNEINREVSELQELAITMNRKSHQETTNETSDTALKEVDELARQYENSTLVKSSQVEEEPKKKGCCASCGIF